jgi:tRNA (mo5U34)-methyltransferase
MTRDPEDIVPQGIDSRNSGEAIRRAIESLGPWFHNVHLPDGSQTAPGHALGDFPRNQWALIGPHLPERLDGRHILDIGCNAGFYSIELARRGAQVTAVDINSGYLAQARWAAAICGVAERIQFARRSVYDLARSAAQYDGVLFMGLFYHLRYPLLGLDVAVRRTREWMLFQTMLTPDEAVIEVEENRPLEAREELMQPGWPKLAFIERRMAGDPTNWWVANHAGVLAMLRSSGLRVIQRIGRETYLCRPAAEAVWAEMITGELDAVYSTKASG